MSKKLLLADDSVTIQKVIEITFANEDYELTIVGNGDEALEKAKLNPPDLILADIIMPGKNGYELCSEIKNIPALAQTPVLLLAGSFEPFDEDKARSVGADSWIAKPFESQSLIEKVKGLLDSPPQPVQMPTTAPVPSLEEKEASLEEIIPLETVVSREAASSLEEPADEELLSEQIVSDGDSFTVQEEEFISEPVFDEPEESVSVGTVPDIMESSPVELEEPFAAQSSEETEEPFVSFEPETTASGPPQEKEMAPAESAKVTFEKPFAVQTPVEAEEPFVSFEPETAASTPSQAEEPVQTEPAEVEFEEPFAVQSSEETEEPFVAVEAETMATMSPVSEVEEVLPLEVEDEDEEEILLLDENDIVIEDEVPAEEDFATDSDAFIEETAPPREEFFENLPESSFDLEPEEEEGGGIVLHRPLGDFSFDETDDSPASAEEEQFSGTSDMSEEVEEPESDREFSFNDLDDGLPEENEISAEPEEALSSAPEPAAELKPPAPSYAQMEQKVHSLTDAQLFAIVEKVAGATIERMAQEILEQVAWEVVPNLSENIIKDEIQKIKAAQ